MHISSKAAILGRSNSKPNKSFFSASHPGETFIRFFLQISVFLFLLNFACFSLSLSQFTSLPVNQTYNAYPSVFMCKPIPSSMTTSIYPNWLSFYFSSYNTPVRVYQSILTDHVYTCTYLLPFLSILTYVSIHLSPTSCLSLCVPMDIFECFSPLVFPPKEVSERK